MNIRIPATYMLFLLIGLSMVPGAEAQFFRNLFSVVTTFFESVTAGVFGIFGFDVGLDRVGPVCRRVVGLVTNNLPDEVTDITGPIACSDCNIALVSVLGGSNARATCAPENDVCVPFDGVEYCGTSEVELSFDIFSIGSGLGSVEGGGCFTIQERDPETGEINKSYQEICIAAGVDSLASIVDVSGGGLDLEELVINKCEITVGDQACTCTLCDGDGDGPGSAASGVKVDCGDIDLDPTEEGTLFLNETDECVGIGLVDRSGKSENLKYIPFMMPVP